MGINTIVLTEANLVAQQGLLAALAAAADGISTGIIAERVNQHVTPGTSIPPAGDTVQVETGWLILYVDTQQFLDPGPDTVPNPGFGQVFQLYWPTAEYAGHLLSNSDFADLADVDVAAFVTAFEAVVVSPYSGAVEIQSMQVIGARL